MHIIRIITFLNTLAQQNYKMALKCLKIWCWLCLYMYIFFAFLDKFFNCLHICTCSLVFTFILCSSKIFLELLIHPEVVLNCFITFRSSFFLITFQIGSAFLSWCWGGFSSGSGTLCCFHFAEEIQFWVWHSVPLINSWWVPFTALLWW